MVDERTRLIRCVVGVSAENTTIVSMLLMCLGASCTVESGIAIAMHDPYAVWSGVGRQPWCASPPKIALKCASPAKATFSRLQQHTKDCYRISKGSYCILSSSLVLEGDTLAASSPGPK